LQVRCSCIAQIFSSAAAVRFPASHSAFSAANEEHIYYFYVSAAFTPGPPGCQQLVVCAYGLIIDSLGYQNHPLYSSSGQQRFAPGQLAAAVV